MGLKADIESDVHSIIYQDWEVRDGQVVPEEIVLKGGGVNLNATVLYADLADSTGLVGGFAARIAASVMKAYLAACTRVIRAENGAVRSFDGDRVMGVFHGATKNTQAARAALKINWTFSNVVKPQLEKAWPVLESGNYRLAQCVGIDTSDLLAVKAGIRNNSDLIWVGKAANIAAKLSSIRDAPYFSFITRPVHEVLMKDAKTTNAGLPMWESCNWAQLPGVELYRSKFWWPVE